MIKRDDRYILTIQDWNTIIKYFDIKPHTVSIIEKPDLMFTEYQVLDIYSKKVLFSFYNHDGMIRISGNSKTVLYEIHISSILTKNSEEPQQKIIDAINVNKHNDIGVGLQKMKAKMVDKKNSWKSRKNY